MVDANVLIKLLESSYHTNKSIYSDTIDVLESYSWPGNVRELENLMENLVITTPGDIIRRENLSERLKFSTENRGFTEDTEVITLKETVERAEYMAIQKAIRQCGSIRKAAVALGVDPSTIVRKQQNYQK